jgi:hypothetical protein
MGRPSGRRSVGAAGGRVESGLMEFGPPVHRLGPRSGGAALVDRRVVGEEDLSRAQQRVGTVAEVAVDDEQVGVAAGAQPTLLDKPPTSAAVDVAAARARARGSPRRTCSSTARGRTPWGLPGAMPESAPATSRTSEEQTWANQLCLRSSASARVQPRSANLAAIDGGGADGGDPRDAAQGEGDRDPGCREAVEQVRWATEAVSAQTGAVLDTVDPGREGLLDGAQRVSVGSDRQSRDVRGVDDQP